MAAWHLIWQAGQQSRQMTASWFYQRGPGGRAGPDDGLSVGRGGRTGTRHHGHP